MNALEKRLNRDPNFVTRKIAGEILLVPIKSSTKELHNLFTLNEVASEAWELMDGQKSLREIQQAIMALFEVDEERVGKDLGQLVEALKEIGAVQEEVQ